MGQGDEPGSAKTNTHHSLQERFYDDIPETCLLDRTELAVSRQIVGRGNYCIVYMGKWKGVNVAVKVPKPSKHRSRDDLLRLQRELNVVSKIYHPNVCMFIGNTHPKDPRRLMIVTELMEGTLNQYLKTNTQTTLKARLSWARDIASGLASLHNGGIVHRDVKPDNMLYNEKLVAKLCDFGLSDVVHNKPLYDRVPRGTPIYMSPEVFDRKEITTKVDIYAFAISLWELLSGGEAFKHHKHYAKFVKCVTKDAERPAVPNAWPACVRELLDACWHQDKDRRPTAAEVVSRLDVILNTLDSTVGNSVPCSAVSTGVVVGAGIGLGSIEGELGATDSKPNTNDTETPSTISPNNNATTTNNTKSNTNNPSPCTETPKASASTAVTSTTTTTTTTPSVDINLSGGTATVPISVAAAPQHEHQKPPPQLTVNTTSDVRLVSPNNRNSNSNTNTSQDLANHNANSNSNNNDNANNNANHTDNMKALYRRSNNQTNNENNHKSNSSGEHNTKRKNASDPLPSASVRVGHLRNSQTTTNEVTVQEPTRIDHSCESNRANSDPQTHLKWRAVFGDKQHVSWPDFLAVFGDCLDLNSASKAQETTAVRQLLTTPDGRVKRDLFERVLSWFGEPPMSPPRDPAPAVMSHTAEFQVSTPMSIAQPTTTTAAIATSHSRPVPTPTAAPAPMQQLSTTPTMSNAMSMLHTGTTSFSATSNCETLLPPIAPPTMHMPLTNNNNNNSCNSTTSCDDDCSSSSSCATFSDRVLGVVSQPWFWSYVSNATAEKLLGNQIVGTYMLYFSPAKSVCFLSVVGAPGHVRHVPIPHDVKRGFLFDGAYCKGLEQVVRKATAHQSFSIKHALCSTQFSCTIPSS